MKFQEQVNPCGLVLGVLSPDENLNGGLERKQSSKRREFVAGGSNCGWLHSSCPRKASLLA